MGYTHYWKVQDEAIKEEVLRDVEEIFVDYQDIIQVEFNDGADPVARKDAIVFNGRGDDGHETFYLAPAGQSGFCKTNGKPYDLAVCETLLVLKHHYGNEFELGSDGFYVSKEGLENGTLNGNWNEAINNVMERYGYEFEFVPKTERSGGFEYHSFEVLSSEEYKERLMEDKKTRLIINKEIELNVRVVEEVLDEKSNLHVLCQRYSDNSHIVWTSHHTGEVETSYVDFYNGKYDMSLEEGLSELNRRSGRDQEFLKGVYGYSGFDEPEKLASDLDEFVELIKTEGVGVESNYLGDVTEDVLSHIDDLKEWQKGNRHVVSEEEFKEDMKELLYEYDIFLDPTRSELEEFNKVHGLPKGLHIEDAFSDKDELTKKLNKAMSMGKGIER